MEDGGPVAIFDPSILDLPSTIHNFPSTIKRLFEVAMLRKNLLLLILGLCLATGSRAQAPIDSLLPVRGITLGAPKPAQVDQFIEFMKKELVPRRVNTLVLRVNYNYKFTSHPEVAGTNALSRAEVKKILAAAREGDIRLIPLVNLLGHQSSRDSLGPLLRAFPQFDETPHVEMPEEYVWPNKDGLYCKSYCPLHPEVHGVVFALIDEVVDAFEADAFHAGMDEVFYIGDDKCPRCSGRDKAELFAGEVTKIRDHLAKKNVELWIWGDRLLDATSTGLGMWEASMNNTHRAIDMIPKDVVINAWHYTTATPMPAYFASKGFRVVACPWRMADVSVRQLELMLRFREGSTPAMKGRFLGMMQTVWSPFSVFADQLYGRAPAVDERGRSQVASFTQLFDAINNIPQIAPAGVEGSN